MPDLAIPCTRLRQCHIRRAEQCSGKLCAVEQAVDHVNAYLDVSGRSTGFDAAGNPRDGLSLHSRSAAALPLLALRSGFRV